MEKEFQTLIVPVLKGLPVTVILIIGASILAARMVIYSTPEYQSTGSIKIDNRNINLGDLALFEEQGRTKGATSVDFLTEVEMFKSKKIKELTFQKLNFELEYFRVGKMKTVELYGNNPLNISYKIKDRKGYDKMIYLKYSNDNQVIWSRNPESFIPEKAVNLNDTVHVDGLSFVASKNESVIKNNEAALRMGDVLAFKVNSLEALVSSVNSGNYFVRSVDKKIQIINLYYQHEVPEKAALFINALMSAYIDYCRDAHTTEANKALTFIDHQLREVKTQLKNAEGQLVNFKTKKSIMNIKQETDATLKEMMQLEFQKVNYDMQEAELSRTFEYLVSGNDLREFAPNFEALKDPLFKEAFLKAQNYELARQDLLLKYTPQSDEIQNIESKIKSMRTFINESVKNALDNMSLRQKEMENSIKEVANNIQEYPDKEQQTAVLKREVKLQEQLYTSLIEKRMEIAVAKSANTVFHQVVDRAEVSKSPISPNKSLYFGVALFFALLIGLGFSFLSHFLTAKIRIKKELRELTEFPLVGSVINVRKDESQLGALGNLYTNLELMRNDKGEGMAPTVLVTSMLRNEGKTFIVSNLSKIYASMGNKVLVIDMNLVNPALHENYGVENKRGLADVLQKFISLRESILKTNTKNLDVIPSGDLHNIIPGILFAPQTTSFIETLKSEYDIILIDSPPIGIVDDITLMMQQVDYNFILFRAKTTKVKTVKVASAKISSLNLENAYGVFNGSKPKHSSKFYNTISITRRVWDTVASIF